MSERLPYEDHLQQHWTDLPLPDENKAWEDMRRRLEEDDDDRPIIAWWRRGCLLWGLLLLVIFGSGLWLVKKKYFTSDDKKKVTVNKQEERSDNKRNDTVSIQDIPSNTDPAPGSTQPKTEGETGPLKEITNGQRSNPAGNPPVNSSGRERRSIPSARNKKDAIKKGTDIQEPEVISRRNGKVAVTGKNDNSIANPVVTGQRKKRKGSDLKKGNNEIANPVVTGKRKNTTVASGSESSNPSNTQKDNGRKAGTIPNQPVKNAIVDVPVKTNIPIVSDQPDTSGRAPDPERLLTSPPEKKVKNNTREPEKKDSSNKKNLFTYSAGISMQQLLPVAGQKTVPYNSQGRKGTLGDYIPSIYFRVNKEKKWFIQGEFRYGAPQYTREFVYKENRREDTSGSQTFTTRSSNTLKKTYYHQLPVTFNYYVTKDWSVGGGLSWNKFVSAISDREVTRRDNSTTRDSVLSKGIVKEKHDSASGFAKSYFQGVFESQYKWKRFSFGARYTFGLQPYLKFTLLNGETGKESNRSLQLFLRYELWRSKKKE